CMEFIDAPSPEADQVFILKGEWTTRTAAAIIHEIGALTVRRETGVPEGKTGAVLDAGAVSRLDTAGAWLLREHFPGASFRRLTARQRAVLDFVAEEAKARAARAAPPARKRFFLPAFFIAAGRRVEEGVAYLCRILTFIGEISARL